MDPPPVEPGSSSPAAQAEPAANLVGSPAPELARDHPLEESQKSYHTILEQEIERAEGELERPAAGLFLSGLSAGLDLSVGPFLIAVVMTASTGIYAQPTVDLLVANAYAVGFIFVVLGRSELFTEHTTAALLPVFARRASVRRLLRLWGLVLSANLVGGTLFALAVSYLGPRLGVVDPAAFGEMARRMVDHSLGIIILSGVAAGWLMGLLTWLVTAARDTVSQILAVWITTGTIGYTRLHHSVAGSVEVLLGVFVGEGATPADFGRFLFGSVLGNAIGGAVFVALLKYGHVQQTHPR